MVPANGAAPEQFSMKFFRNGAIILFKHVVPIPKKLELFYHHVFSDRLHGV